MRPRPGNPDCDYGGHGSRCQAGHSHQECRDARKRPRCGVRRVRQDGHHHPRCARGHRRGVRPRHGRGRPSHACPEHRGEERASPGACGGGLRRQPRHRQASCEGLAPGVGPGPCLYDRRSGGFCGQRAHDERAWHRSGGIGSACRRACRPGQDAALLCLGRPACGPYCARRHGEAHECRRHRRAARDGHQDRHAHGRQRAHGRCHPEAGGRRRGCGWCAARGQRRRDSPPAGAGQGRHGGRRRERCPCSGAR